MRGALTEYIDVAQITLYAFWFFFAGLVWYLRGEDRREGYPLESEGVPQFNDQKGWLYIPPPKTYRLQNGDTIKYPAFTKDPRPFNADKVEPWPGSPFQPKGDPLLAAMGPGSWVTRPEKTYTDAARRGPHRAAARGHPLPSVARRRRPHGSAGHRRRQDRGGNDQGSLGRSLGKHRAIL